MLRSLWRRVRHILFFSLNLFSSFKHTFDDRKEHVINLRWNAINITAFTHAYNIYIYIIFVMYSVCGYVCVCCIPHSRYLCGKENNARLSIPYETRVVIMSGWFIKNYGGSKFWIMLAGVIIFLFTKGVVSLYHGVHPFVLFVFRTRFHIIIMFKS